MAETLQEGYLDFSQIFGYKDEKDEEYDKEENNNYQPQKYNSGKEHTAKDNPTSLARFVSDDFVPEKPIVVSRRMVKERKSKNAAMMSSCKHCSFVTRFQSDLESHMETDHFDLGMEMPPSQVYKQQVNPTQPVHIQPNLDNQVPVAPIVIGRKQLKQRRLAAAMAENSMNQSEPDHKQRKTSSPFNENGSISPFGSSNTRAPSPFSQTNMRVPSPLSSGDMRTPSPFNSDSMRSPSPFNSNTMRSQSPFNENTTIKSEPDYDEPQPSYEKPIDMNRLEVKPINNKKTSYYMKGQLIGERLAGVDRTQTTATEGESNGIDKDSVVKKEPKVEKPQQPVNPDVVYPCRFCVKAFNNTGNRSKHEKNMHPNQNAVKSLIARKTPTLADTYLPHPPQKVTEFYCEFCDKYLEKELYLEQHYEMTHFRCGRCLVSFDDKPGIRAHNRQFHDPNIKFQTCRLCNQKFENRNSLLFKHMRSDHKNGENDKNKVEPKVERKTLEDMDHW